MANEVDYSPCKYLGNSSTREFSYDWKLMEIEELIVILEKVTTGEKTILVRGSDYTALNNAVGGSITLTVAPSNEYYIVIERSTSQYQEKAYSTSTGFQGDEIEKSFDKTSCCLQDMQHSIVVFEADVDDKIEALDERVLAATETSNEALENSETAISTANSANEKSDTALSNSQTAVSTANSANEKSDTALSNSQTAVSTANSAEEIAVRAEDKVDEFGQDIEEVIEAAGKINELEEAVATAVQAAGTATAQAQTATYEATTATTAAQTATAQAEEAKAKVGNLADLTTETKSTVVSAINEVNSKVGAKYLREFFWSDHLINNMAVLRADTFSWHDGTVYSNVYNDLNKLTSATLKTDTYGDITIEYYELEDKTKVCLATQESNLVNLFNLTGVAWYYILDTTNTRFKLPRTKYGFVGLRDEVGKFVDESLPNITGGFSGNFISQATSGIGACSNSVFSGNPNWNITSNGGERYTSIDFNASHSSSTYQDNAPVQQKSTQMYLYFYVGEFSQTATEQTAGVTTEVLNNKVDLDASNLNADGKSLISGFSMPSSTTQTTLTWGNSGTRYTAPANGYFNCSARINTGGTLALWNVTVNLSNIDRSQYNNVLCRSYIYVNKGDIVELQHVNYASSGGINFIYANGEV